MTAKIILDSIALNGKRLITMELCYPRFIHSEFLTHRVFSRNAASSRAIPVKKKLDRIKLAPVEPVEWGKNKPGMQSIELLTPEIEENARSIWHRARLVCMSAAAELDDLQVHKQIANRIIEPWDTITTICTATEWANFLALRDHPDADPNIQKLARAMREAMKASKPTRRIGDGQWHLPFIQEDEKHLDLDILKRVSAARCARVSYLTHDGKKDITKDLELFDRLTKRAVESKEPGHWSPIEHVAYPNDSFKFYQAQVMFDCDFCQERYQSISKSDKTGLWTPMIVQMFQPDGNSAMICWRCAQGHVCSGNFIGWHQYRKDFENENL